MGLQEIRESLVFKQAEAYLRQDVYYTYACQTCNKEDISTPVVKTPKEPSIIPGSYASPEAVAYIAVQKFVMCAPLYRQELDWNRKNIMISRQTMANWLIRCARDWFAPVYEKLHKELVTREILHSDETSIQVLHEDGKTPQSKSSMWLYRTSGDAEHPIVLYQLRRKFEDARNVMPKGKRSPTAEQGVAYCTKLFELEKSFKKLTPEERKKQRLEQEKPVLDAMLAWANTRQAAPKSKLGMALTYLQNQWEYLNNYLLDGRIELSNNRAERSIKPFVMSRKNFLFANTPNGAQSSAVIFSLIETAKENGLDPYRYLTWVLQTAPTLDRTQEGWAANLLPWRAPESCK